jgi:hypothetical protein
MMQKRGIAFKLKGGIHFAPPSAILPVWERRHPSTLLVELTTLALWKNFSHFFRTMQPANIIWNGCAGLNNLYVLGVVGAATRLGIPAETCSFVPNVAVRSLLRPELFLRVHVNLFAFGFMLCGN